MAGLALLGSGTTSPSVAVHPASSVSTLADAPVAHGLAVVAPKVVALRASRSRTVAVKKVTKAAPKKVVASDAWFRPSAAGIVSPFGPRWGRMHKGVDFGAHYGAPIRAIGDGVVVGTGYQSGESGYGQITIIRHSNGFYSAYAHQSSYLVHEGEHVSAGEVIGYVGATGEVTGPHLHFEIRTEPHGGQINPLPWLRQHGVDV
jgi:murein DD-endopeptidase MepM/ murein hydrolase activator NlpD